MNNKLKLVDAETGEQLRVGSTVKTFRGELGVLRSWKEPYCFEENAYRGAKVYVQLDGGEFQSEFYPSVIGAKFVGA